MVIQPIFFVKRTKKIFPIFNYYVVHIHREEEKKIPMSQTS